MAHQMTENWHAWKINKVGFPHTAESQRHTCSPCTNPYPNWSIGNSVGRSFYQISIAWPYYIPWLGDSVVRIQSCGRILCAGHHWRSVPLPQGSSWAIILRDSWVSFVPQEYVGEIQGKFLHVGCIGLHVPQSHSHMRIFFQIRLSL